MSFLAREQSKHDSRPIELYRFSMNDQEWLYTSSDHVITLEDKQYIPIYISRGSFTRSGDINKSTLEITVSASEDITFGFRSGWLPSIMTVTISRFHYRDAATESIMIWKGRVTGCKWGDSTAVLSSDSAFTILKRLGLRRIYQVGCPHVLFGEQCGVNPNAYVMTPTISTVNGQNIVLSSVGGAPDGYLTGGVLSIGPVTMMIIAHVGTSITLLDSVPEAVVGIGVQVWPGCNRTLATCHASFTNEHNYGGLPFLPVDNPFSGDALV
jgi:uncharacterized phage protein (TIGR02218 family)